MHDDGDEGDEDRLAREAQIVAMPAQQRRKPGGRQTRECRAMRCSAVHGLGDGTTVAAMGKGKGKGKERGVRKGSERGSMTSGASCGVTEEEVETVRRRRRMKCPEAHGFVAAAAAAAAEQRLGLLSAG